MRFQDKADDDREIKAPPDLLSSAESFRTYTHELAGHYAKQQRNHQLAQSRNMWIVAACAGAVLLLLAVISMF